MGMFIVGGGEVELDRLDVYFGSRGNYCDIFCKCECRINNLYSLCICLIRGMEEFSFGIMFGRGGVV